MLNTVLNNYFEEYTSRIGIQRQPQSQKKKKDLALRRKENVEKLPINSITGRGGSSESLLMMGDVSKLDRNLNSPLVKCPRQCLK